MNKQIIKKVTLLEQVQYFYNSLSNTDKEYIRRGIDDRARRIKQLIREFKKYRKQEQAGELLSLLSEVKKLGEDQ